MKNDNIVKKQKKEKGMMVSTIMGLIAAIAIFAIFLNIEKNTLMNYEKATVVMAKKADILGTNKNGIPEGLLITEKNVSEYFIIGEIEKNNKPNNAVSSFEELYNKKITNNIDAGSVITKAFLEDYNELLKEDTNYVKVSFELDRISQGLNGMIRSGDLIDIYNYRVTLSAPDGEYFTKKVWENVFVYEVFTSSNERIKTDDITKVAQLITVLIPDENVADFFLEFNSNNLKISKVSK